MVVVSCLNDGQPFARLLTKHTWSTVVPSAQAVAAEASAVAASIGCFVFAAGSSNRSSS